MLARRRCTTVACLAWPASRGARRGEDGSLPVSVRGGPVGGRVDEGISAKMSSIALANHDSSASRKGAGAASVGASRSSSQSVVIICLTPFKQRPLRHSR